MVFVPASDVFHAMYFKPNPVRGSSVAVAKVFLVFVFGQEVRWGRAIVGHFEPWRHGLSRPVTIAGTRAPRITDLPGDESTPIEPGAWPRDPGSPQTD